MAHVIYPIYNVSESTSSLIFISDSTAECYDCRMGSVDIHIRTSIVLLEHDRGSKKRIKKNYQAAGSY